MTNNTENCEHEYQEIASEHIAERWQNREIDDDELSGSEIIDRMNGDERTLVTYQCTLCGDQYQNEEM